MDDRNAQVGWTEAQWNRVRDEVLRAWQTVRVAGSFLPVYGPLPRGTQVVPSERVRDDGTVDDQATANLLEIVLPVRLTRQQVGEEELSSALLEFRRRATQLGQLEDWFVFNGASPSEGLPPRSTMAEEAASYLPSSRFLDELIDRNWRVVKGAPAPIASAGAQVTGLRWRNPGALGLYAGAEPRPQSQDRRRPRPDDQGLIDAFIDAMTLLQDRGYVAPYVAVLGRGPFQAAYRPVGASLVFPRDRLEPLSGRELVHGSALDVPPRGPAGGPAADYNRWSDRAVLLSLASGAVDLAVATEATPEFRQVDEEGRYLFAVFERFTLRIKDPTAIVPLAFGPPVAPTWPVDGRIAGLLRSLRDVAPAVYVLNRVFRRRSG
jgi:hypothetical protein